MSVFDVKRNPAICVLPWVHQFKSIDNGQAPCCQTHRNFNSDENIEQVRDSMLKGIRPDICKSCYKSEDTTGWSFRTHETKDWLKKFGEPDVNDPKVQHIDVRFNSTCNLKCKMCGPDASTLWQKEKRLVIKSQNDNKSYFDNVDKENLKKVYLAGGEPTFIKEYLQFLQELNEVNPDCEIMINTNLKKLPQPWKELILKIKRLSVICSCDAIESLGSYVRYPLGWNEFEENVKFVSDNANFLQFNLVSSNLTSHKIYETCRWMSKYSNSINITPLTEPHVFTENAVPIEHRSTYINNIKKLLKFPVSIHYAGRFKSQVMALMDKYSYAEYNALNHKKLQEEITEQDSHRSLQLRYVDPFLHQWIYG